MNSISHQTTQNFRSVALLESLPGCLLFAKIQLAGDFPWFHMERSLFVPGQRSDHAALQQTAEVLRCERGKHVKRKMKILSNFKKYINWKRSMLMPLHSREHYLSLTERRYTFQKKTKCIHVQMDGFSNNVLTSDTKSPGIFNCDAYKSLVNIPLCIPAFQIIWPGLYQEFALLLPLVSGLCSKCCTCTFCTVFSSSNYFLIPYQ